MSDRERTALQKAIDANTDEPYRSRSHPATIRAEGNGTVDVDFEDGGPGPRASSVRKVYGVPGIRCELAMGTRCRVSYDNGDPRKRIACGFDEQSATAPLDVASINIANANDSQGAARNGDDVGGGSLVWVQGPPGPGGIPTGGVLTYTPFPSIANPTPTPIVWAVVGPILITQLSPASATPTMALGGAINGGSSIVKIGG